MVLLKNEELADYLARFIMEARRKDGQEYPPNTLYQIVVGIQRYMRENVAASWCIFHTKCPECTQKCDCYLLWCNLAMNLFFNYKECTFHSIDGSKCNDIGLWNSHLLGSQFGIDDKQCHKLPCCMFSSNDCPGMTMHG